MSNENIISDFDKLYITNKKYNEEIYNKLTEIEKINSKNKDDIIIELTKKNYNLEEEIENLRFNLNALLKMSCYKLA